MYEIHVYQGKLKVRAKASTFQAALDAACKYFNKADCDVRVFDMKKQTQICELRRTDIRIDIPNLV